MKNRITNYIRAGYPALYIQSAEEQRVEAELSAVADDIGYNLFAWSIGQGIIDIKSGHVASASGDPLEMIEAFAKLPEKSLLLARDFHLFLTEPNPMIIRKLKDAFAIGKQTNRVFVVLGCRLHMLPELEKEMTFIEFQLPDRDQLRIVLDGIAKSAGLTLNGNTDELLDAASGLTTIEAENAFALSVVEAQDIKPEIVAREKADSIKKNGIIEIVETKTGADDIGGLDILKEWIGKRRLAFSREAKAYGLPVPKGVLAVGIPGSGKSLSAKATANILGVPLLKLDGGKLFGSLVGESERNMRSAIQTAEAIAPCVLWCDEIEKSFSGSKSSGSTDGGTSARVFGTFLQWMQDKTAPVFVFATANDISQLPPEFLRKGRFDELFFVDLPDKAERVAIWRVHIAKRNRSADKFDIERLAERTDGFTGAEIEAAVTEALFAAFDDHSQIDDSYLMTAVTNTVPLSRTMSTQIEALRAWSTGRARRASTPSAVSKSGRKLS